MILPKCRFSCIFYTYTRAASRKQHLGWPNLRPAQTSVGLNQLIALAFMHLNQIQLPFTVSQMPSLDCSDKLHGILYHFVCFVTMRFNKLSRYLCSNATTRFLLTLCRLMGKPTVCIGENKDADQHREADQRLCFRYSDSTIPLPLKSEISSF